MKHRRGNRLVALGGVMLELMMSVAGLTVSVAVVTVDLYFLINAVALVVVVDRCLNSFFGEHRAMNLNGRKSVKSLYNCLIGKLKRIVYALTLDQLGCHRRCSDSSTASEGLELNVNYDIVLDLEKYLHYIAACCVSDLAYCRGIFDFAYVSGIGEVIHYFCTVVHII